MKLYNSLSRSIESFKPINSPTVTMYVCGITPYDTTHLGHAFTYIFFDVLNRYLKHQEYSVVYTQNVTDINDRDNDILKRAKEQKIPWEELAGFWTKRFLDDMATLNWIPPTNYLKASEHIPTMISLIKQILNHNIAYEVEGNVYLDITKIKEYGKLSQLSVKDMLQRAKQFEEDLKNPNKRNPLDITLWKAAKKRQPNHIPSFDPGLVGLSRGRPGWHIECSAMAICSLGEQIDIHGGGIDLIYPHHESEIAQSESATKKIPFAKYWIHTGTVMYKGEKMSKSLGNLILVSNLLKKYSPNAIRWLLLSHHYRTEWEFQEEDLDTAEKTVEKITQILPTYDIRGGSSEEIAYKKDFEEALQSDMDTPKALSLIKTWAQEVHSKQGNEAALQSDAIFDSLKILGFNLKKVNYQT